MMDAWAFKGTAMGYMGCIRLHCAISKSSLWNMGHVACGSAFERPRIYCTNSFVCGHSKAPSQATYPMYHSEDLEVAQ